MLIQKLFHLFGVFVVVNPQNIEADIRKKLLPRMFQECKAIGGGMDQAKKIVEMIVQITRVGLNGA